MDPRVSITSRQSTGSDMEYLIRDSCDFIDDSLSEKHSSSYGAVDPLGRSNTIITMSAFDQFSAHTVCPYCKEETETVLRHHTGSATFKCFILLVLLTCGLLACLPFLLKDFKDVDHVCQHCGKTIATYKRKFISR
jgi:hypothetical protein